MPLITYKFADGHSEEIEVSDEVAAAFAQLEKYEKKVERKETRRHVSLNLLMENGFDFSVDDPIFWMFSIRKNKKNRNGEKNDSAGITLKTRKRKSFHCLPFGKQMRTFGINICIFRKQRLQGI